MCRVALWGCALLPSQAPSGLHRQLVWGRALGAVRCPSALLAARTACILRQRTARGRTAHAGRAPSQEGGFGGVLGVRAVGWQAAWARTARLRAPLPSWSAEERKGFFGPRPGSSGPHRGSRGPHPGAGGPPCSCRVQGVKGTGCGQGAGGA